MVSTSSTAPLWGWAQQPFRKERANDPMLGRETCRCELPHHRDTADRSTAPEGWCSFVLLPKEDSRPHCGVDPKSNNVIPFKITPPKPWFGIGPDWIQFFFLPKGPKCQFTYCKSITIRAAKGLNDLGYYETQNLWLWLSSPGINRGKGKCTIHGRFTEKSTINVGCHFDYRMVFGDGYNS